MKKLKVFIGSSTESLDVAFAIQSNLERDTDPTVWQQGVFKLNESNLNNLMISLDNYECGIFVLSPVDLLEIHGQNYTAVRDNVLFELGLFFGRLGLQRTFFIIPRTKETIRIPSDLIGVKYASYDPYREDGNLLAALGPACNEILEYLKKNKYSLNTAYDSDSVRNDRMIISKNREHHYEISIDLIKSAKNRLFLIERTPVLLLGPRHYWYEKEYHLALSKFAKSTEVTQERNFRTLYVLPDSKEEIKNKNNLKEVIDNIHFYKTLENASEGRFSISSLPTYNGSFLVSDNSCAVWFKGNQDSIGIYKIDDRKMSDILVDVFYRLTSSISKSEAILIDEISN